MMKDFLRELKRRRVLHTASLYVVGAWIALQVVEVLADAGLPPSTTRSLLIILSIGFPIALVTGWFFDISKDGVIKTSPLKEGEQLPQLKLSDHALLAGMILVVAIDIYILSLPSPQNIPMAETGADYEATIAVLEFEDTGLVEGADPVGSVVAGELRSSLSRVTGLRVLGPETSKVLAQAGENRIRMARELMVTSMLLGEVSLDERQIQVATRLVGIPSGDELWSATTRSQLTEVGGLQRNLIRQIVGVVAPKLDADSAQGVSLEAESCKDVWDLYLQGKQLSQKRHVTEASMRKRGVELLREAVAIDENCASAWEALAVEAMVERNTNAYVKASSLARRALNISEDLPEAWTVLADIAAEEARWGESEDLYLRALHVDPTNALANMEYGETLLNRGRVREALHYVLEAYRYEPASARVNLWVSFIAAPAGDGDLVIKHVTNFMDLSGDRHPYALNPLAEGYLLKGETGLALEIYAEISDRVVDWFPDCVRYRDQPEMYPGLATKVESTIAAFMSGDYGDHLGPWFGWQAMRCGTWIGVTEPILDMLIEHDLNTDNRFYGVFYSEAGKLRRHSRFRELVTKYGLLDDWRERGWPDFCQPNGDSFHCD